MIVTSRRSLILGALSTIVAPSLVRATSLMQIRGDLLDPWVLAYQDGPHNFVLSQYHYETTTYPPASAPGGYLDHMKWSWHKLTPQQKANFLNRSMDHWYQPWQVRRKSELSPPYDG